MSFAFAVLFDRVVLPDAVRANRVKAHQLHGEPLTNAVAIAELEAQYQKWKAQNIAEMCDYYIKAVAAAWMLSEEEDRHGEPAWGGHGGHGGYGGNGGHGGLL